MRQLPFQTSFSALLTTALLSSSLHAFQTVHVVNGGSGSALQLAVDAAVSGDTILVHNGNFGAIEIVGKALTIVAEPSLSTQVQGLRIAGTTATQATTVTGLRVIAPAYSGTPPIPPCVVIEQCAGSVRLENVNASVATPNGSPALRVQSSDDVALYECTLRGSDGLINPTLAFLLPPYGEGVRVIQSRVAAYESTITGGNGMNGFTQDACSNPYTWINNEGGAGVALDAASTWYSSGGTIQGGKGGNGFPARCSCFLGTLIAGNHGSAGGAGIDNDAAATAVVFATTINGGLGGSGGAPATCSGTPGGGGLPGAAGMPSTNPISALPGTRVQISGPSVIRAGQILTLTLRGTPGDLAQVGLSFEAQWLPFFPASGVLLIGPSGRRVPVGVFPASGVLSVSVPTAIAVPGAQSSQWRLQSFGFSVGGGGFDVGAGWDVTVLDPMF